MGQKLRIVSCLTCGVGGLVCDSLWTLNSPYINPYMNCNRDRVWGPVIAREKVTIKLGMKIKSKSKSKARLSPSVSFPTQTMFLSLCVCVCAGPGRVRFIFAPSIHTQTTVCTTAAGTFARDEARGERKGRAGLGNLTPHALLRTLHPARWNSGATRSTTNATIAPSKKPVA
jgi:hypothetical protein